jgi:Gamma tubulin complex component N-terminal/Gamma tubulin complex component C-terminal
VDFNAQYWEGRYTIQQVCTSVTLCQTIVCHQPVYVSILSNLPAAHGSGHAIAHLVSAFHAHACTQPHMWAACLSFMPPVDLIVIAVFCLRPQPMVASFLAKYARKILTTGKYLNVVRECGQSVQCPHAGPITMDAADASDTRSVNNVHWSCAAWRPRCRAESAYLRMRCVICSARLSRLCVVRERAEAFGAATHTCSNTLTVFALAYTHWRTHAHRYGEIVEVAYGFASRTLLDVILGECQLLGRLRTLKHFFLLDQGDLFVHFMDVAEEELRKEVRQGADVCRRVQDQYLFSPFQPSTLLLL